jgi:hypothetical protein
LLIASCNNTELEELKTKNLELQKQLDIQQTELDKIEDAIVIPFDSLYQYCMPLTFGKDLLDNGEEVTFQTALAWAKFPNGIEVDWKITDGKAELIDKDYKNDLMREVSQIHSTSGEKEIYGDYIITFPNGKTREMKWGRFVTVN